MQCVRICRRGTQSVSTRHQQSPTEVSRRDPRDPAGTGQEPSLTLKPLHTHQHQHLSSSCSFLPLSALQGDTLSVFIKGQDVQLTPLMQLITSNCVVSFASLVAVTPPKFNPEVFGVFSIGECERANELWSEKKKHLGRSLFIDVFAVLLAVSSAVSC